MALWRSRCLIDGYRSCSGDRSSPLQATNRFSSPWFLDRDLVGILRKLVSLFNPFDLQDHWRWCFVDFCCKLTKGEEGENEEER